MGNIVSTCKACPSVARISPQLGTNCTERIKGQSNEAIYLAIVSVFLDKRIKFNFGRDNWIKFDFSSWDKITSEWPWMTSHDVTLPMTSCDVTFSMMSWKHDI